MLKQCMSRGIVNYRKLAKLLQPMISQMLGREVSVDVIKIALIRSAAKICSEGDVKREVLEVLARVKLMLSPGSCPEERREDPREVV